jgi:predicted hydrolase (HD superfamily)
MRDARARAALGADEDAFGITGLLHDFDYERWPSLEDHPFRGSEILEAKGYRSGYAGRYCPTGSTRG